jgi:hypothetical protein
MAAPSDDAPTAENDQQGSRQLSVNRDADCWLPSVTTSSWASGNSGHRP